jgi:hypothetical protein
MSQKKKSKPSFEVPSDIESSSQSGWVYRSDEETEEVVAVIETFESGAEVAGEGPEDATLASDVMALALATMAQAVTFSVLIVTVPFAMGLRAIESVGSKEG